MIRTIPPAQWAAGLDKLLTQLRIIDPGSELEIIVSYLLAAIEEVENYTGLGLITQTWEQSFPALTTPMFLRRRPVQEIDTITYLDDGGTEITLDVSFYRVSGLGVDKMPGAAVHLGSAQSWPTSYTGGGDVVRVSYVVGYGDTEAAVPEMAKHAVLLTAATMYNYRENVHEGAAVAELPMAARNLLRDWRPLAVA